MPITKKAVLASIRSPNTPKNLKKGLRKFARSKGWLKPLNKGGKKRKQ